MKKLMIAAAIVCAAALSHGAAFDWEIAMGGEVSLPGGASYAEGMNAYIFAASTDGSGATVGQSALVSAFNAGTLDLSTAGSLASKEMLTGGYFETGDEFDYGAKGDTTSFYFALIGKDANNKDILYISDTQSGYGYDTGKSDTMSFDEATASAAAAMDASKGYSTAGWYESVPEPTSGLLLLLGVAGLALKRKRA